MPNKKEVVTPHFYYFYYFYCNFINPKRLYTLYNEICHSNFVGF